MKLMILSDEESPALWDYFTEDRVSGIDLILSCGDLDPDYLSFLATFYHGSIVYVPGNHDGGPNKRQPDGCICADGRLVVQKGLRIVGLGGCIRYNRGEHQYTESEMRRRAWRLQPQIWRHQGFDILLTHAPAKGCGDGSGPHAGFSTFCTLMDRYQPRLMVHGHLHQRYDPNFQRERRYGATRVVNGCGWVVIEL
ncbi:MAG: metallophosphoesterase [Oscillospiraceae bacterium]|nr:metallophosphoesterase [Oscillospiraceae bacterium]